MEIAQPTAAPRADAHDGVNFVEQCRQVHLYRGWIVFTVAGGAIWLGLSFLMTRLAPPMPTAVCLVVVAMVVSFMSQRLRTKWLQSTLKIVVNPTSIRVEASGFPSSDIPIDWVGTCWPVKHGVRIKFGRSRGPSFPRFIFLCSERPKALAAAISEASAQLAKKPH